MKADQLWLVLLFTTFLACNLQDSRATGKINVRLLSYENSQSRDSNGNCCELMCTSACDNYFRLCFANPGSSSHCSLWDKRTKFLGYDKFKFPGDLGNSIKNPIDYKFAKWKGLDFYVEVWDDDSTTADDLVAMYTLNIRDKAAWGSSVASAHQYKLSGVYFRLDVEVKVFCDKNYFVPDCATHCAPQNDVTGHYTCDYVNGRRVCLSGWYGTDCLTYCVSRNDSTGYYFCDNKGQMICLPGWRGDNCTVPVFRQSNISSSSNSVILSSPNPTLQSDMNSQDHTVVPTNKFLASSTLPINHIKSSIYSTCRTLDSSSIHSSSSMYSFSSLQIGHSSHEMSSHSTVGKQQSSTKAIQLSPSHSIAGQAKSSYQTLVKSEPATPALIIPSSNLQFTRLSLKRSVVPNFPGSSSSSNSIAAVSENQEKETKTEALHIRSSVSLHSSGQSPTHSSYKISLYSSARTRSSLTNSFQMVPGVTEEAKSSSRRSDTLTRNLIQTQSETLGLSSRSFTYQTVDLSRKTSMSIVPSLITASTTRSITAVGSKTKEGEEKTSLSVSTVTKVHSCCNPISLSSSLLSTRSKAIPTQLLNTSRHSTNIKESSREQVATVMSTTPSSSVDRTSITSLLLLLPSESNPVIDSQSISNTLIDTPTSATVTPTRPPDIESIVIELQSVEHGELDPNKVKEELHLLLLEKLNDFCWKNAKACNIPEDMTHLNRSEIFSRDDVVVQVQRATDGLSVTVKTSLPHGLEGSFPIETLLEILHEEKDTIEDLTHTKVTRIHTLYFNNSSKTSQRTSTKEFNVVACISGVCALLFFLLITVSVVRKVLRRNARNFKVSPHSEVYSMESPSISLAATERAFPLFDTAGFLENGKDVQDMQLDFQMSTTCEEFECSSTGPGQVPLIDDSPLKRCNHQVGHNLTVQGYGN